MRASDRGLGAGMHMQFYAQAHPVDVVGTVLVDSSHGDLDLRTPEALVKLNDTAYRVLGRGLRFLQMLDAAGILALFSDWMARSWFSPIPDQVRAKLLGIACSDTRWFETAIARLHALIPAESR